MELVDTRVLIIHRQVTQAVRLKQSLEQLGRYEVAAFTSLDAALEYLETRPQHVAVLDFTLPHMSGAEMVALVRAIQPGIGIIASPRLPQIVEAANTLELNGIIDMPINTRELIPLIQQATTEILETLSDTAMAPPMNGESETLIIEEAPDGQPAAPDFSSLNSVLDNMGGMDVVAADTLDLDDEADEVAESANEVDSKHEESDTLEVVFTNENGHNGSHPVDEDLVEEAVEVFRQLAAEEPPLPGFEDSGTVRDLFASMQQADLREVVEALKLTPASVTPLPFDEQEEASGETGSTAQVILQSAFGGEYDNSPTLEEMLSTLIQRFPEDPSGVKPLPSWLRELERYVKEPEFLQDMPTSAYIPPDDNQAYDTTRPNPAIWDSIEDSPGDLETEHIASGQRDEPDTGSWMPPSPVDEAAGPPRPPVDDVPPVSPISDSQPEMEPVQPRESEARVEEGPLLTIGSESRDPRIARLALGLTQLSLEMTAEATLLTHGMEIIAYAGDLPMEEITEIRQMLYTGPEKQTVKARIRFITLESSGMDYMLYSKRTEDGFTLSMVFSGDTPVRAIRTQANRLAEALDRVPENVLDQWVGDSVDYQDLEQLEAEAQAQEEAARESTQELRLEQQTLTGERSGLPDAAPEAVESPPVRTLTTCTYLWMLRDPDMVLTEAIAQAIVRDLDAELTRDGWKVAQLQVYEDFVYMLADVPADQSAHELLPMLKRRSAEIAQGVVVSLDPDTLWGDNYCVLTPGRELEAEEIQEFINFVRMY